MRKITATFNDAAIDIAVRKQEAARSRGQPRDPRLEPPREATREGYRLIADALAPDGFAFAPSGPRLTKHNGDLTYFISFQADRNNIAGRRAAVWIHGGVSSRTLGRWRQEHPNPWTSGPPSPVIAGGQIGNLREPWTWMEWDFSNRAGRSATAADAVHAVREIAFPFFAKFDDIPTAVETLSCDKPPWPHIVSLIEFAWSAVGREAAQDVGRQFLARHPTLLDHSDKRWKLSDSRARLPVGDTTPEIWPRFPWWPSWNSWIFRTDV